MARVEKDSVSHNIGGMNTFLERYKLPKLTQEKKVGNLKSLVSIKSVYS